MEKEITRPYIIDIRDGAAYAYGHMPSAVNIAAENLDKAELPKDREIIIYCKSGDISPAAAEQLRERGFNASHVPGGYIGWLTEKMNRSDPTEISEHAEKSIRKKFHKKLFSRFTKAIVEYELIQPNDKIAVCISGGKDSFVMAKLFQELKRHNKVPFELVFLVMDPGYSPENRKIIENNAKLLNIPVTIFETDIFNDVFNIEKSPCYICARMRRGHLYHMAKELGCNKIALGHHYDDVIETILMGMLYGGQIQTMMPKLKSNNFEGMQLIRPMYLIREDAIKAWRDYNGLGFIQCACRFTEKYYSDEEHSNGSKRLKMKQLIRKLESEDPGIEQNIFRSVENVSLKTLIAYKDKNGEKHRFTDEY